MSQPQHFIEAHYKGCVYRYYGWAHIPGARCVGEGDWRAVADGKEYRTSGQIIPANVLADVVAELGLRDNPSRESLGTDNGNG